MKLTKKLNTPEAIPVVNLKVSVTTFSKVSPNSDNVLFVYVTS